MKSLVFKRSIMVAGHKTSVSLEDAFWNALKEIARERHMRLSELVAKIDAQRQLGNLCCVGNPAVGCLSLGHASVA
jgi:predicted DNA-binding ribbon-helix-helix protein